MITIKNLQVKSGKLESIDLLRFIASVSVFFYHYGFWNYLKQVGLEKFDFITVFGSTYAVPLFFVISGLCIHLSNKSVIEGKSLHVWQYYRKRFLRIYPPYIFAILFSFTVLAIADEQVKTGLKDFVLKLSFTHVYFENYFNSVNVVLWTIAIEAGFYIIYPIFFKIRQTAGLTNSLFIVFIISCISVGLLNYLNIDTLPGRWFFINFWFMWCLGAAIADLMMSGKTHITIKLKHIVFTVVTLAVSITVSFFIKYDFYIVDQLHCLAGMALLILFLRFESFFQAHKRKLVIFTSLGTAGYSIYLLHEPLITLKNFAMKQLLLSGNIAVHLTAFFIILLLCYVSYVFVENPYIVYARSTKKKAN